MLSRSHEPRDSGDDGTRGSVSETLDTRKQIEAINQSLKAVILANTREEVDQGQAAESRVGTLPTLLRDILSVQKVGAKRIIVCIDPFTGRAYSANSRKPGASPSAFGGFGRPQTRHCLSY
jgi:hypothetical protein